MKKDDVFNRRQVERPLQLGIHDISLSRYFTIKDSLIKYRMVYRNGKEYSVYLIEDRIECIGYAKPDRNKIIISVRRDGIDWESRIPLSDIHIYGEL